MKSIYLLVILICSVFFFLDNSITKAQWSNNPAVNLTVCDTTGEQALAKIGATSDGGHQTDY